MMGSKVDTAYRAHGKNVFEKRKTSSMIRVGVRATLHRKLHVRDS